MTGKKKEVLLVGGPFDGERLNLLPTATMVQTGLVKGISWQYRPDGESDRWIGQPVRAKGDGWVPA